MTPALPRPVTGVGVVVTRPDGAIAIGHRVTAGERPTWCLPGGHLEGGEAPVAGGLRETAEECGVLAAEGRLVGVCVQTAGSGVVFAVHAEVAADAELHVLEPHAVDAWRWCPPDALPEPLYPATVAVLHAWRGAPGPLPGWSVHRIA